MTISRAEMETYFNMMGDDHTVWHIFSDDPYWQRRLERVGATAVKREPNGDGIHYTLPANQLSLRMPRKPMSQADRERNAMRLAQARRTSIK